MSTEGQVEILLQVILSGTATMWNSVTHYPLVGKEYFPLLFSEFGHLTYSGQRDFKNLEAMRNLNKHLYISTWALITLPSTQEHAWISCWSKRDM